jgi:hypothetical protein
LRFESESARRFRFRAGLRATRLRVPISDVTVTKGKIRTQSLIGSLCGCTSDRLPSFNDSTPTLHAVSIQHRRTILPSLRPNKCKPGIADVRGQPDHHSDLRSHRPVKIAVLLESSCLSKRTEAGDGCNIGVTFNTATDGPLSVETYKEIFTAVHRERVTRLKNWLTSLDFVERHENLCRQRAGGTGSWFLKEEIVRRWMSGDIRWVWCSGAREFRLSNEIEPRIDLFSAGIGKTIMSCVYQASVFTLWNDSLPTDHSYLAHCVNNTHPPPRHSH